MPATYGRPKPPTLSAKPKPRSLSSRSPSPLTEFNQDWKQKLKDIDNDEYEGEIVHEAATSSTLTPLVSSSSLSAAPEAQPLPRSSPPASPSNAYRDTEMTDDPDTSVELNTVAASSEPEPQDEAKDDTDDDEPALKRRMSKPLRIVDSDEDDKPRRFVASTSSAMSSGNDLSQMSVDRMRSSNPTTPASSARKPIKLALSNEESEGGEDPADRIEAASSPKTSRSRKKGLSKAEKVEMAKTQQAIAASRDIRIPNASKRIDPKAYLSSYTASLTHSHTQLQAEIDSYPFPPGTRSQKSTDPKASLRNKIAGMRPLSAHAAPKAKFKPQSSDPIVGSSQSAPAAVVTDDDQDGDPGEEEAEEAPLFGKPNALGMSMFGATAEESASDEELPPVKSLLFGARGKPPPPPPPKTGLAGDHHAALAAKKLAAIAAQAKQKQRMTSDSDSDIEIGSQPGKAKPKSTTRVLARPGQSVSISTPQKTRIKHEVTDSQIIRAGHTNHFGRDAAELSSPVKGAGEYEESQWGRSGKVLVPSSGGRTPGWKGTTRTRSKGAGVSTSQLLKHAAKSAFVDGQTRQRADEERWKKAGGRVTKRDGGGVGVEDAVREALERADGQPGGQDEDDEDEEDEDYRGSASEEERGSASGSEEEEDKENLPAAGRGRKPHEPVSDFEGSVEGGEAGDEDKENSLELVGVGSPAVVGRSPARSPGPNGLSPAMQMNRLSPATHLNGLSPATQLNGLVPATLSPSRLIARSPSRPFGRSPSHLRLHSRVSSSGSGRQPLSELGDDDNVEGENAAVARAPLGELEVELEPEEDEVVRRPMKRPRQSLARRLLDDEDDDEGVPGSPSQRRLGSPSQRRLGSPSQRFGSPSQRFGSPSQRRLGSPSLRFGSPTPRSQPSRLRSLPSGTQSFSQMQTQDMLGGLGDVFGFESQAPAEKKDDDEGGGLTQLFAASGAGPSKAFAALRNDVNEFELTQDDRAKLLYKPVISEEEMKRDQELFEREDDLMAQPFSPTQKEKETQMWLNDRGLWTQTKPAQSEMPTQLETQANTPMELPRSTPIDSTDLGTPSVLASPTSSASGGQRRRIIRRGLASGSGSADEAPSAKIPSMYERLLGGTQAAKESKAKKGKKKLARSEFVEGEAAESDDEYGDFGPRLREEGEEDEDEDRHVEGLVDDQVMDAETEGADHVQAKFMEQNAEEDAQREKVAREVVTGKLRTRRRGRDNMDLDDDDDESEGEGRSRSKNFLKKRKIENDGLDELERHDSTRAFVQAYNKGIKSAEDDEFAHLNQVDDPLGEEPELAADEYEEDGEEGEGEGEDEDEDEGEGDGTLMEPETPMVPTRTYIPSSANVEIGFYESDEEPTINLPDADARKGPSHVLGKPVMNSRAQKWAAQEGGSSRVNYNRIGQGVSVTGHNSKAKGIKTKGNPLRPNASTASSSNSNKLSRLGSKADGFR